MGEIKKEFKWFNITQYKQEEEYLSSMHSKGWKLVNIVFPGFYYFEKCEPKEVTYRLDYNRDSIKNKDEYVQMFSDCGWEYFFTFFGYSYFRKASDEAEENNEIFSDDESKFDMMKRVYRGKIIPLIVIFLANIIPQFVMNIVGNGLSSVNNVLALVFLILGVLYLCEFGVFTEQMYRYERKLHSEDETVKRKYMLIFSAIIVCALAFGCAIAFKISSEYHVKDTSTGFAIESTHLNKSVAKELDLNKGI